MLAAIKTKLKGFRTFIGAGAISLVGALGLLGSFDLTPLVQVFVKSPDALPLAMLGVGIFFGYMRYISDTAVFQSQGAGDTLMKVNASDAGV
jgi:hypothetical protein